MKKLMYFLIGAGVATLFSIIVFFNMYSKAMGKEAVVSINNERVQKEEVIENLKRQYWDISLNNTINMKLLNLAVEEHKIDLSQKDLDNFKKNSSFLKQSDLIKMSKDEQAKYLKEMYILNIVAKKKTLSKSSSFGTFIHTTSAINPKISNKTHTVRYLERNDEKLITKAEGLFKKKYSIAEVEEKLKVEFKTKQLSMFNEEGIPLENMKIKDFVHVHIKTSLEENMESQIQSNTNHETAVKEDSKKDEHASHENKMIHAIVVLTDIDKKNMPSKNDIDKIKTDYLNSSFFLEVENVYNYLRGQHTIKYL
ncbi:hypothetical protein [Bacillus wiedmannii]|uniref:hypothetical protein n=1 Tax=Bacillus wiedmannii TaxID=1890302 RepID=UPI000869C361|nr:hypothetical protein [Bacillus wiedmannii]MBG9856031.1 hypothetical protein [Bacillus wiedmannii]SCN41694.1 Protein of unknown function [Bacillus wiedmannii]